MRKSGAWLIVLALALGCATTAGAQSAGTGAVAGTVRDSSGAVVPGAEVVVRNIETGAERRFTTTDVGYYAAPYLQPGRYELRIKKEGFAEVIRQNVQVQVGLTLPVDIELPVKATVETVTVTSEVGLVETEKTEVSQTIGQEQVENLPLNGRNWTNLVLLTPGVSEDGGFGGISFRGISSLYNNNMMDGADNNQAFFSEARGRTRIAYAYSINSIKEFQVQTAAFSAEYGRAAGGVVNAVTKSGTNDWHGDFFYFIRDDVLLARDPRANATGQPKPPERRQQFGGAFGGPIVRDKLFFFVNYDQQKRNFPPIITPFSPNFFDETSSGSQALLCVQQAANPLLGITPQDCRDAQSQMLPIMLTTIPRKGDQYLGLAKVDYQWNANNRINGSFNILRWNSPNGIFTGPVLTITEQNNGTDRVDNEYGIVTWNSVWKPTLVNEARFQYGRDFEAQVPNHSGPNIQITGAANFGMPNFLPRGRFPDEKRYQWADNVSWLLGRHQVKFGTDINHVRNNIQNLFQGGGILSYSGNLTVPFAGATLPSPTPQGCSASAVGNPNFTGVTCSLAALTRFVRDLELGTRTYNNFTQSVDPITGSGVGLFTTNDYNFYVQDNIKLRPNFTLNLGLRYEVQDLPSVVQPNPLVPENGTLNTDTNNFGPRVGFSWGIGREQKQVLRGGYGMYYGRTQNSTIFVHLFQNGVFQRNFTFLGDRTTGSGTSLVALPPSCGAPTIPNVTFPQPSTAPAFTPIFGSSGPTPTNQFADFDAFSAACGTGTPLIGQTLSPDFVNPLVHQYDIAYEVELPWRLSFNANYVGSRANHLPVFYDDNLPPPSATATYLVFDQFNPANPIAVTGTSNRFTVPFFVVNAANPRPRAAAGITGPLIMGRSVINSWYNGMVLRLRRRESKGFSFDLNYTLSKALDNGQVAGVNGTFAGTVLPLNPFDLRGEYGISEIDIRNRFITNIYWVLPFGNMTDNKALQQVIGGWKLASVWRIQDGRPLTATMNGRPSCSTGLGGLTCGTASAQGFGVNGRVPFIQRNTQFTTPGLVTIDLRAARVFKITERADFEFIWEAFNLFNRTNPVPSSGIFAVDERMFDLISPGSSSSGVACPTVAASGIPDLQGCLGLREAPRVAPSDAFGAIRSTGNTLVTARQMQFGLKVRF